MLQRIQPPRPPHPDQRPVTRPSPPPIGRSRSSPSNRPQRPCHVAPSPSNLAETPPCCSAPSPSPTNPPSSPPSPPRPLRPVPRVRPNLGAVPVPHGRSSTHCIISHPKTSPCDIAAPPRRTPYRTPRPPSTSSIEQSQSITPHNSGAHAPPLLIPFPARQFILHPASLVSPKEIS